MNDLLVLALLVLVVLAGSALCSGIEAALLTVNPVRIHELTASSRPVRGARRLAYLRQRLGRTLAVLVIANNGFNIFGSLMLGGYAAQVFSRQGFEGAGLTMFSVGLTVLVMLLGEILPKALGSRFALPVALASATPLHWFGLMIRPLVLILERLLPAITAESEISTDENEIRLLARLGSQKGLIEADEAAMIAKVFQLNDLTARDLMTPRVVAPTLEATTTPNQARPQLMANHAEWWVLLGEEVDEILGIASRERLLTALVEGQGQLTAIQLSEAVEYVPEMIRADRLLTGFRRNSGGVRVVVDEFGGFVGVIGAEAVLAVLAGWWRRPLNSTTQAAP